MDIVKTHYRFQFHDDQSLHNQIYTLPLNTNITVADRYSLLRFIADAASVHLDVHRLFVD